MEYYKKTEEEKQAERAAAMEKAQQMGLPELEGTEKQVAWAIVLRDQSLEHVKKFMEEDMLHGDLTDEEKALYRAAFKIMSQKAKASFWINNRTNFNIESQLLRIADTAEAKELAEKELEAVKAETAKAKADAEEEAEKAAEKLAHDVEEVKKLDEGSFFDEMSKQVMAAAKSYAEYRKLLMAKGMHAAATETAFYDRYEPLAKRCVKLLSVKYPQVGATDYATEYFPEMLRDLLKDASDVKSTVKAFCEDMAKKSDELKK